MRTLVLLVALSLLTGCTSMVGESWLTGDKGRFLMAGDAAGMQAASDMFSGFITNGKASDDIESSFWQHRKKQTEAGVLKLQLRSGGKKK